MSGRRRSPTQGSRSPRDIAEDGAAPEHQDRERGGENQDASSGSTSVQHVEINESADGQRLDNFLMAQFRGVPRSVIYRIIRKGEVRVNKGRAKAVTRLQVGDIVRLPPVRTKSTPAIARPSSAVLEALELPLFEDEHLLIINKPSGLAVHSGTGIESGLIEQLRVARPELDFAELAHRLDRATSGCLIIAKSRSVLTSLHDSLRGDDVRLEKIYTALLRGDVGTSRRVIDTPVGEREARSIFTLERVVGDEHLQASLVKIDLLTGRNHQARIHAESIGHPVAGDDRHGDRKFNRSMRTVGLKRLFLHASLLSFAHPVTDMPVIARAPLPGRLEKVLEALDTEAV